MIFISYASVDRVVAKRLHNTFVNCGLAAWIDYQNLDLKHDVERQIVAAVRESASLVLVVSPASISSSWVRLELSLGMRYGKPVRLVPAMFR